MAPPTTTPTHRGTLKPVTRATSTAMGAISVMVPTEVPMASDTKQATTNSTATEKRAGTTESIKYATLWAELRPTTPTNAPAVRKISSMLMIFLSPTPRPISSSFCSKFSFGFCRQATRIATRKAMTMGIL